jgi:pimeloyl-ACP methyl ester carboxylesterase
MSNRKARLKFSLDALRIGLGAPVSIGAMAERARLTTSDGAARDCACITAPTLIITGEPHLDRVVPVESSAEYERLIPNARRVMLRGTGHLGSMTRPRKFAALIRAFFEGHRHAAA